MADTDPSICFATMVRDDDLFLRLWVQHYARFVPRDHLVILVDGLDQPIPAFAQGCQIIRMPRPAVTAGWNVKRWVMLSDLNTFLLNRFDIVVLNDVDEILLADPDQGGDLIAEISKAREVGVISPFAVEVVHRFDVCPDPIRLDQPILRQRPHVRLNASYNKPCITAVPVRWSLGGHYSDYPELTLSPSIYLFHLNRIDLGILRERQNRRLAFTQSAASAGVTDASGPGWRKSGAEAEDFLRGLQELGPPEATDFRFEWQRKRMTGDWAFDKAQGIWRHARFANRRTYIVPERFHDLF